MTRFMYKNFDCEGKTFTVTVEFRYRIDDNGIHHKISIRDLGYARYEKQELATDEQLENTINSMIKETCNIFSNPNLNTQAISILLSLNFKE